MTSFADIFERCGATEMARRISPDDPADPEFVDPNTAAGWKRVGSIPATYWKRIAEAGIASLEELAEAAANRSRAGAAAESKAA